MHTRTEVLETVNSRLTGAGIPSYTELRDQLCSLDAELERGRVTAPRFRRIVFNALTAGSSLSKMMVVQVNGVDVSPSLRQEALEQSEAMLAGAGMPSYASLRDAMGQASIELELGRLSKPKAWRKRLGALIAQSCVQGGEQIALDPAMVAKVSTKKGHRRAYAVRVVPPGMVFSKTAGCKLYGRERAQRIADYLQKRGVQANIDPILISSTQRIAV